MDPFESAFLKYRPIAVRGFNAIGLVSGALAAPDC